MTTESFPSYFYCPITYEIMTDPVIDREGNTYERSAIAEWLSRTGESPLTRTRMSIYDLVPNRILRNLIEDARNKETKKANPSSGQNSPQLFSPFVSTPAYTNEIRRSISPSFFINTDIRPWEIHSSYQCMQESQGWSQLQYYKTISSIIVGSKIIVFGRFKNALHLIAFDSVSESWTALPTFERMSDASGWSHPQYYETIRSVAIGSRIYIFGRGAAYLHMFSFDMQTNSWTQHPGMRELADNHGWSAKIYHRTIRLVAIGSKLYIFGRGSRSLQLFSFDTETEAWAVLPGLEQMTDADGWLQPQYYETIRVLSAGHQLLVFGRGANCVHLLVFDTVLNVWSAPAAQLCEFTDEQGWDEPQYYLTLRLVVMGPRLLLLGRGATSVQFFCFHIPSDEWAAMPSLPQFTDEADWDRNRNYMTLVAVPSGPRLFLMGRGREGLQLFSFDFMGCCWEEHTPLRKFTDAEGWDEEASYSTIKVEVVGRKLFVVGRGRDQLQLCSFDPILAQQLLQDD